MSSWIKKWIKKQKKTKSTDSNEWRNESGVVFATQNTVLCTSETSHPLTAAGPKVWLGRSRAEGQQGLEVSPLPEGPGLGFHYRCDNNQSVCAKRYITSEEGVLSVQRTSQQWKQEIREQLRASSQLVKILLKKLQSVLGWQFKKEKWSDFLQPFWLGLICYAQNL